MGVGKLGSTWMRGGGPEGAGTEEGERKNGGWVLTHVPGHGGEVTSMDSCFTSVGGIGAVRRVTKGGRQGGREGKRGREREREEARRNHFC